MKGFILAGVLIILLDLLVAIPTEDGQSDKVCKHKIQKKLRNNDKVFCVSRKNNPHSMKKTFQNLMM